MTWHLVTLAVAGTTALLVFLTFRTIKDLPTRFIVLAIWARYVLSAFHEYTFPKVVAGLSYNAMFSISVALVGLALIPPRFYLQLRLLPTAAIVFVVAASGLINAEFRGMASDLTKWLYFVVAVLLLYRGALIYGTDRLLRALLAAASTPLIMQILSVAARSPLRGSDGQLAYIGGYSHEAAFSTVLFMILCLGALIRWRYAITGLLLVPLCIAGIMLANYRTTVIASLPLVAILVGGTVLRWMPPLLRPVSGIYLLAGGVGLLVLTIPFMSERFLEVFVVLQSGFDLVKPPDDFSWEEISLFSGRLYLWSNYVYTWLHSSAQVHIIGFGPEAWAGVMPLYAHNTFVSYLYEFGFVGLMLLLVFFGTHVLTMTKVRPPFMAAKLTAALLGYLTLNLATMPLWEIEGVILLAILCATAWAILDGAEQDETTPAVPPTPTKRKPIGARWQRSPRGHADVGGTAPAPVERPAVVSGGNRRSVAAARARSSRKAGSPGARPG